MPDLVATDFPLFSCRVYYEDTDAAGIVYYANYLKFAERARTEALRGLGIDQSALKQESGIGFVVRRAEVDFIKPAMLDDELTIKTDLIEIKGASISMQQTIFRKNDALALLKIKLAVLGSTLQPVRIPSEIHTKLQFFLKTCL